MQSTASCSPKVRVALLIHLSIVSNQACGDISIVSFQFEGPATIRDEVTPGLRVGGFGVKGNSLAFGGTLEPGGVNSGAGIGLVSGSTSGPLTRSDFISANGVYRPQLGMHQAISFDNSDRPVLTYTKRASAEMELNGGNTAIKLAYEPNAGAFVETIIAEDAGNPRASAIAIGPQETYAIYSGNWDSAPANPGPESETIVLAGSDVERHTSVHGNFAGPLKFDTLGNLHQAIVDETVMGRDLHYLRRDSDGTWSDLIIDDIDHGDGAFMTGHIDLELNLAGKPVVIGNSAGEGVFDHTLSVHELTDEGWVEHAIELDSYFPFNEFTTGPQKQIVFDSSGEAHVALSTDFPGGQRGVAYIRFASDWTVTETRAFYTIGFFGLGVADDGTVYLGIDPAKDPVPPVNLSGDYNDNGIVDAADYTVWRDTVGNVVDPCSGADDNCDGFVANGEYQVWKDHFGEVAPSGTQSSRDFRSVPEPASALIIISMLCGPALNRRRR